jgi:hypothetical protein
MHQATCMLMMLAVALNTVAAQQKPDFSGEWVLNREASSLPAPVKVTSGVVRIDHREPVFSFHRNYVIDGVSREAQFTVKTGGSEQAQEGPTKGLTTISTLRWDGNALVLAMRIKGPDFEATNDVRYELQEGGRRLRASERGRGPHENHDAVWIYDRR